MWEVAAVEADRSSGGPWESLLPSELFHVPLCHVAARRGECAELRISGALPDAWPLRLARAFARRKISLCRGGARAIEPGLWLARLEVDLGPCGELPPDVLQLALRPDGRFQLPEPPILDFSLIGTSVRGGRLELEVHAWDAVGLLAAVLGRVEAAGIVPEEMLLETEDDCAFHQLVLRGRDGGAPAPALRAALARSLALLVRGR
jgi:hypothetical protein